MPDLDGMQPPAIFLDVVTDSSDCVRHDENLQSRSSPVELVNDSLTFFVGLERCDHSDFEPNEVKDCPEQYGHSRYLAKYYRLFFVTYRLSSTTVSPVTRCMNISADVPGL